MQNCYLCRTISCIFSVLLNILKAWLLVQYNILWFFKNLYLISHILGILDVWAFWIFQISHSDKEPCHENSSTLEKSRIIEGHIAGLWLIVYQLWGLYHCSFLLLSLLLTLPYTTCNGAKGSVQIKLKIKIREFIMVTIRTWSRRPECRRSTT